MPTYKYPPALLADAAAKSVSIAGVLRVLGIRWTGGSHAHISRQLKKFGIDTSHFTGASHNRGNTASRNTPEQVLVRLAAGSGRIPGFRLRRAMRAIGIPESCSHCGVGTTWRGGQLILHVDHINGDFLDNRRENLRFLCPNCHSQTATYAGRARPATPCPYRTAVLNFALANPHLGSKTISRALRERPVDPVDAGVSKVSAILNAAGLNTRAARQAAAEAASGDGGGCGQPLQ